MAPATENARTLKCHQVGVPAYFRHRLTSAGCEGVNGPIQAIRVAARGFRNREHFRAAVRFHCGGPDLYPDIHSIPR